MGNTLKLTVHRKAFEVMVTGEKTNEFRRRSKWLDSRLWKKVGTISGGVPVYEKKNYDFIEIRNGYGKSRPVFVAEFKGFVENVTPFMVKFSNDLTVEVKPQDQILILGKIIKIENYEMESNL